jgi:hypothetical protein
MAAHYRVSGSRSYRSLGSRNVHSADLVRIWPPADGPDVEVCRNDDTIVFQHKKHVPRRIGPPPPVPIANEPPLLSDIGDELRLVAEAAHNRMHIGRLPFGIGRNTPVVTRRRRLQKRNKKRRSSQKLCPKPAIGSLRANCSPAIVSNSRYA